MKKWRVLLTVSGVRTGCGFLSAWSTLWRQEQPRDSARRREDCRQPTAMVLSHLAYTVLKLLIRKT